MSNIFPIPTNSSKVYATLSIPISTTNFGTHYSHFGVGGFVEVPTVNYRNSIPISNEMNSDGVSSGRRKLGMLVYVVDEQKTYQLQPIHGQSSGPVLSGTLVTLQQWNNASNAQKMVWLDPTQEREDVDGASPTYNLIVGSNKVSDAWIDVTPLFSTVFRAVSGNWQSAYNTVLANSAVNWDNSLATSYADGRFLPLTGGTIDGNLSIHGNLYITGNTAQISATNITISDPLIFLAHGNPSNSFDLGFVAEYNQTPLGAQHTGLVRLHDKGEWTLFTGLTTEPLTSTSISRTDSTFKIDTLNANLKGNLLTSTNVFGYLSSNNVLYARGGNSDLWNSTYTIVCANSASWGAGLTTLAALSANWQSTYLTTSALSANWNSVYTTVQTNSAGWGAGLTTLAALSANWQSTYLTTSALSANWNSVYTTVQTNSAIWQGTTTTVRSNSASWGAGLTTLAALSANWQSTYLTTSALSANWNVAYTTVQTNSANWNSVYTTVQNNSATNWDNGAIASYVNSNFLPLSGGTLTNNLNVVGSISATDFVYKRTKLNFVASTYTFRLSDQNTMVLFNSPNAVSAIVPADATQAFANGAEVNFTSLGAGIVYIAGEPSVNIRAADGRNYLRVTNSSATVMKLSSNDWLLFGDIWSSAL